MLKKVVNYIKKYPFDATIWGLIIMGLGFAAYIAYNVFLVDDLGVKYGNRLDGIEAIPVARNEIKEKIAKDQRINNVAIEVKGRIINVEVLTEEVASAKVIDELSTLALTSISQELKDYYDIQFFIAVKDYKKTDKSPVIGYLKSGNEVMAWTFNKGAYNE